jgi:hypothetical protein
VQCGMSSTLTSSLLAIVQLEAQTDAGGGATVLCSMLYAQTQACVCTYKMHRHACLYKPYNTQWGLGFVSFATVSSRCRLAVRVTIEHLKSLGLPVMESTTSSTPQSIVPSQQSFALTADVPASHRIQDPSTHGRVDGNNHSMWA